MTAKLSLFQYKSHELVQLTDGRQPFTADAYRDGWRFIEEIDATPESIARVSAKAASEVLHDVGRQGYVQLARFEITTAWRVAHAHEAKAAQQ